MGFFMAIYSLQEEKGRVSYEDLAMGLAIPVTLVQAYITTLVSKGIPITHKTIEKIAKELNP